jgi:hypothetical protein
MGQSCKSKSIGLIGIASKRSSLPLFFSLDTAINGYFTLIINVLMCEKYTNVVGDRATQGRTRKPPPAKDPSGTNV